MIEEEQHRQKEEIEEAAVGTVIEIDKEDQTTKTTESRLDTRARTMREQEKHTKNPEGTKDRRKQEGVLRPTDRIKYEYRSHTENN